MAHVPFLYLPPPWSGPTLEVTDAARHHLTRVLRRRDGDPVSYTDGAGTRGAGTWSDGSVVRGEERRQPPPDPRVTLAVAPPHSHHRARYLVEKTAELGVARIGWLHTAYGQGRPPPPNKAERWVTAALEQSRGVWRTELMGAVDWSSLPAGSLVADPAGRPYSALAPELGSEVTIVVGPEGGFHPDELGLGHPRVSLSDRVLRVETAAVVAVALVHSIPGNGD